MITNEALEEIRDKISKKKASLMKCEEKFNSSKELMAKLKKEISDAEHDLRFAEMEQFCDFLTESGFSFSEIILAVKNGDVAKTQVESDKDNLQKIQENPEKPENNENCATNSAEEGEVKPNDISDS